jgi:type III pantothenate kinase
LILAVDIGNTHICLGTAEGNDVQPIARLVSDPLRTEHEYAVLIRQMLYVEGIVGAAFEGSILSSVVPPITGTMKVALEMVTGKKPLVVGSGLKTGLNIRIDDPAQLGSDLVVGAVAALHECRPPLVILDMGTATTFSVVDGRGDFLGGAILPGLGLSISALAGGTSQLPDIQIEAPEKCIGTNTVDSMKSGAVFGTAAMIDGMVERIERELGEPVTLLATGGLSGRVVQYCSHEIRYDPDLLLKGLAILYQKNKKN